MLTPASHRPRSAVAACLIPAWLLLWPQGAAGETFRVTGTVDAVDAAPGNGVCATTEGVCTVRAAIQEANASPGPHVIVLPQGTYILSIAGRDEDDAATGDLDIRRDITIDGAGSASAILDGNSIDRLFHIVAPAVHLHLANLTLQNGVDGVYADGGPLTLQNGELVGGQTTLTLTSTIVRRCGYAISTRHGSLATVSIADTRVEDNFYGMWLSEATVVTIARGTIARNSGGGLHAQSEIAATINVTDTVIAGNQGGGAFLSGVSATLARVTVSDNRSAHGAGIRTSAVPGYDPTHVTVTDSTIRDNSGQYGGGGVLAENLYESRGTRNSLTILRSTITGNSAAGGGGIYIFGALATIANTTISGNTGSDGAGGLFARGNVSLVNNTIVGNTSGGGAAVDVTSSVSALNTIIANGASTSNCTGLMTDLGHNLEFPGTSCGFALPSDVRADPQLLPLAANGGLTKTHRLGIGSPARDAGDDAACAGTATGGTDQRRADRATTGAHCDIGAYESATLPFHDEPLVPGVTIRAVHITELRAGIDDARLRLGLSETTWTDGAIDGVMVRAIHLQELRESLLDAYAAAGWPPPAFTDHPLVGGVTPIRARHIAELREALLGID